MFTPTTVVLIGGAMVVIAVVTLERCLQGAREWGSATIAGRSQESFTDALCGDAMTGPTCVATAMDDLPHEYED